MQESELLFLKALSEVLHSGNIKEKFPNTSSEEHFSASELQTSKLSLVKIARQQKILPVIYEFLCSRELELPKEELSALNREISGYALTCYQNRYFSALVCSILENAALPYALMKGVLLSELYPKPEYRRFGDIDIFINEQDAFLKAEALLKKNGFSRQPSNGDHHHEYTIEKDGRTYLVELHQSLISSQENPELNQKIEKIYGTLVLNKVLPVTHDALYLLLHMLEHMLDAGFGIKLLCDWVLYLEQKSDKIDSKLLKNMLDELGIFTFANNITAFCIEYLGLRIYPDCFFYNPESKKTKEALLALAEDIFSGGEFGSNDPSRMIIMKGDFRLKDYFLELHRQTKKNYPKLWKTIIFLPILWFFSGVRFLRNNKQVRHTDMKTILATTKKRQRLLEDMDLRL